MSTKYHQQHPTISFRCQNIDEYNEIKKMVKSSGKSESTFIREILLNVKVKESESFNSGYVQGFNKSEIPCSICGKYIIIDLTKNSEALQKIIEIFGEYAHTECIENQKKQQEAERRKKADDWFNSKY
ncbi:MAG: hypothetical protein KAR64_05845 [Thermoplasmatales archaeon]|nr:hypothetical protein [Thermoplasmatales archaeon]